MLLGLKLWVWAVFLGAWFRIGRFDLRFKKIRNGDLRLVAGLLALGYAVLAVHTCLGQLFSWPPGLSWLFYRHSLSYVLFSGVAAALLWQLRIWPAGDAKLFVLHALSCPLLKAPNGFGAGRMTADVLSNIFIPAACTLVFKASMYLAQTRWRHVMYFLKELGFRRFPEYIAGKMKVILAQARAEVLDFFKSLRHPWRILDALGAWLTMVFLMAVVSAYLGLIGIRGLAQGMACLLVSMLFSRIPGFWKKTLSYGGLILAVAWWIGLIPAPLGLASIGNSLAAVSCFSFFIFIGSQYARRLIGDDFLAAALPLLFFLAGSLPLGRWLSGFHHPMAGVWPWALMGFVLGLGFALVRAWDQDFSERILPANLGPYLNLAPATLTRIRQDQEFHERHFRVLYADGLSPEQAEALKLWCGENSIQEVVLAPTISFSGWIFAGYLIPHLFNGYVLTPFF